MSTDQGPTRVRFYKGQFLQAEDLQDEQAYHVQMRWRHNLALHSWGIVAGLELRVTTTDEDATLEVGQGMAIDGYGRELVLAYGESRSLRESSKEITYDVWLEYGLDEPRPVPPRRPNGCAAPSAADRREERPEVRLEPTTARRSPDPSRPNEVSTGDFDFRPDRPPPDDPNQKWPVFLGRIAYRDRDRAWQVDPSERRYAGLVAERVVSPASLRDEQSGRTVILNGSEPGLSPYQFAVLTGDADGRSDLEDHPPFLAVAGEGGKTQLELSADRVTVAGNMVFKDGAAMEFQANPVGREEDHNQPLAGAEHWRVYHHFQPPPKPKEGEKPVGGFSDELRITMPAVPAGADSVVIGCFSEKGKFTPILAVKDDQTVEVYGALKVEGQIHGRIADVPAGTPAAPGRLTPGQVLDQLESYWANGQIQPAALLDLVVRHLDPWTAFAKAAMKREAVAMITAVHGLEAAQRKEAVRTMGKLFPEDATDASDLLEGMLEGTTDRARVFASKMFGQRAGRAAAARALKDKLLTKWPPSKDNVPADLPLLLLFRQLKLHMIKVQINTNPIEERPFKEVVRVFGSKIDELADDA